MNNTIWREDAKDLKDQSERQRKHFLENLNVWNVSICKPNSRLQPLKTIEQRRGMSFK